jgi:hypothetical protein
VIVVAVRWYLRFNLSYRDVQELLAERGGLDKPRQVGPELTHRTTGSPVTPLATGGMSMRRTSRSTVFGGTSTLKVRPNEVVPDAAAIYPAVLAELIPSAWHHVEQYANNPIEADHSQLKQRLRPMRGLRTDRTAQVIIAGHAFMQNLRRGHYELGIGATPAGRVATAFTELARAI